MIGQLELSEAATDRIVVFHHNFFRYDAHIADRDQTLPYHYGS